MLGFQLKLSAKVFPTGAMGYALVETVIERDRDRETERANSKKSHYYIVEFENLHTKVGGSSRVDDDGII